VLLISGACHHLKNVDTRTSLCCANIRIRERPENYCRYME
jgi:hypothetical protein